MSSSSARGLQQPFPAASASSLAHWRHRHPMGHPHLQEKVILEVEQDDAPKKRNQALLDRINPRPAHLRPRRSRRTLCPRNQLDHLEPHFHPAAAIATEGEAQRRPHLCI